MKLLKNTIINMRKANFKLTLIAYLCLVLFTGCKDDISNTSIAVKGSSDLIPTPTFNWEIDSWMPTPPFQTRISVPWIGSGSLAGTYGDDVLQDHKASDGWMLVYNTFDTNSPGALIDPYFILYNKYNGIMRIYKYITTSFVNTSSYIQDNIQITNVNSKMLNFLGTDIVDVATNRTSYSQIQPIQTGTGKWYMYQYEIAYDPQNRTYTGSKIAWSSNFYDVVQIDLSGKITGTIKSTIGATDQSSTVFSKLGQAGTVIGKSVLYGIGKDILKGDSLGLSKPVYEALFDGVSKALGSSLGGIPGTVVNLLSAVFGGGSSAPTMSFDLNGTMNLKGTSTSSGEFPSRFSFWTPGSIMPQNQQGFAPVDTITLGVFNLSARPKVPIIRSGQSFPGLDWCILSTGVEQVDNSGLIQYNPAVLQDAYVTLVKQEELLIPNCGGISDWALLGDETHYGTIESVGDHAQIFVNPKVIVIGDANAFSYTFTKAVRFTIKVTPKNGAPAALIVKTFLAD